MLSWYRGEKYVSSTLLGFVTGTMNQTDKRQPNWSKGTQIELMVLILCSWEKHGEWKPKVVVRFKVCMPFLIKGDKLSRHNPRREAWTSRDGEPWDTDQEIYDSKGLLQEGVSCRFTSVLLAVVRVLSCN